MKRGFCRQGSFHLRAEILLLLIVLAGFCWLNTACAKEVYTWKDKNGVTHFSDLPPASGNSQLIQVEDVYSPGSAGAHPVEDTAGAGPPGENDEPMTENPQTLAQQLRDQLASDRKERKEARVESAALCEKNRQFLARIEPARRVMYTNEQGEEVRMDDEQRVNLIKEAEDFIAKNCK
jgi:hypothetical protein